MGRRTKRTTFGKQTLFALVTVTGFAAIAEVGARAIDRWTYVSIDELRSVYETRRNWRLGKSWPLQRGDYPYLPYVLNPAFPEVNELGFRGASFSRHKAPDSFRIVCLGGSTTFNGYPAYLEEALQDDFAREGLRLEVINGGNQQWTTMDSLISFITRCLPLEPDAVVVYHAVNDAVFAFGDQTSPDYSHLRKRFDRDTPLFWDHLPEFLDGSSALVGIRAVFERKVGQRGIPITVTREHTHPEHRRYNGMGPFRENLRTLASVAAGRNIEVFLATQVFNREYEYRSPLQERWGDAVDDANAISRALADELDNVHVIDAAGALRGSNEWMTDYAHFTEEGKGRIARFIADGIRPHLSDMLAKRDPTELHTSRATRLHDGS